MAYVSRCPLSPCHEHHTLCVRGVVKCISPLWLVEFAVMRVRLVLVQTRVARSTHTHNVHQMQVCIGYFSTTPYVNVLAPLLEHFR